jgi:hypothetical protein
MLPQTYLCLFVWCKACHHQGAADLQAIIDAGKGDRPLKDLKFRCAKCGSRLTDNRTTTDVPAAAVPIADVSLTLRASRRSGPEFPYRLTAIGEHYVRQYSAGDRPPPRSSRAWLILPTAVLAA